MRHPIKTVARWVKNTLAETGVNTKIFLFDISSANSKTEIWALILIISWKWHCVKYLRNFLVWKFAERRSFRKVSGNLPKTMRKLCLSTKFPHQKIGWNYGILHRVGCCTQQSTFRRFYSKELKYMGRNNRAAETIVNGFKN